MRKSCKSLNRSAQRFLVILISCLVRCHISEASNLSMNPVPFVGCPSDDGQSAPTGKTMYLDFPKSISARLAIYSGGYQTILAPRGWRCTATEGSAEESLSIYPASEKQSKDSQIIYSITWSGDSQSGIRTKFSYAGSYFPNVVNGNTIENFIQQSNLNETISKFLAARHKSDKIVLLSDHSLSFVSPPSIAGLGSDILGYPSLLQTMGIMTVSNEPDGGEISFFVLRLRQPESDLKEDLLEFQERCFDSANWCSKIATYSN